ncbi:MAG: four helix bundle protein [Candidatus Moranbacteria bacterium]|nr:four helix bundle protein [Candidatus Moranbacteria bacterium]
MTKSTDKYREFETRTTYFAKRIIRLCRALPKGIVNEKLIGQIVRSSGSVGANYREANEAVGKKDFLYRLRIARKECKETEHWLDLILEANPDFSERTKDLYEEGRQIRNILSAIIKKSTS